MAFFIHIKEVMQLIAVQIAPNSLEIEGHAGYAKKGNDIICAAVSMLAQNLVNSLEDLTEDKITCHIWDGHIDIKWKSLSEQGALLIDSFFLGICELVNTYGEKYVQIK